MGGSMSSLIPSGSASGTGSMTLAAPVTNSNQTATLPDATGTVMVSGNMPAFSAYLLANQTPITSATFTKIQCNTEEFDTASAYDNATNYRFTPQVAGYYQVSGSLNISASVTNTGILCVIYKNGSSIKWGVYMTRASTANDAGVVASALVYLNGSTDYVELYGYVDGAGTLSFIGSQQRTFFQAVLVRGA
jgi:hypothetical protein